MVNKSKIFLVTPRNSSRRLDWEIGTTILGKGSGYLVGINAADKYLRNVGVYCQPGYVESLTEVTGYVCKQCVDT